MKALGDKPEAFFYVCIEKENQSQVVWLKTRKRIRAVKTGVHSASRGFLSFQDTQVGFGADGCAGRSFVPHTIGIFGHENLESGSALKMAQDII